MQKSVITKRNNEHSIEKKTKTEQAHKMITGKKQHDRKQIKTEKKVLRMTNCKISQHDKSQIKQKMCMTDER